MRGWTKKTDREAAEFYGTLSERELRTRQDLARQQIQMAYRQNNQDAMLDLQSMERALTNELFRRLSDQLGETQ